MIPPQSILTTFPAVSQALRKNGSYFEELVRTDLRHEPRFWETASVLHEHTDL